MEQIKELYVPIENKVEFGTDFQESYNIRYFNITKWVVDKKENSLEKLVNVYEVLSNEDCNIALVFNRTETNTEVFLAVVNTKNDSDNVNVENYRKRLLEAIKGNFLDLQSRMKRELVGFLVYQTLSLIQWQRCLIYQLPNLKNLSVKPSKN